jgi:glutamate formiminotransferase
MRRRRAVIVIECVPNFSEGRDRTVCEAIRRAIESAGAGVRFLDLEMDANHHRSVFTFVGSSAPALEEAAVRAAREARDRIDLTNHSGEHPRMGAMDVCPFVPISGASMEDCAALARAAGRRLGEELKIPVFLYGAAASPARPERRDLAAIRTKQRQFEQLRELIGRDPAFEPDFGPSRIHPTAGCTAVGAREPLIAYNVNLDSADVALAKAIAKAVRERDGGLPGIKALGMMMDSTGLAQVSMNVCDYKATSLRRVYREIERRAAEAGVHVHSSEVVGLLPEAALEPGWIEELRLEGGGFDPARQIIERRVAT